MERATVGLFFFFLDNHPEYIEMVIKSIAKAKYRKNKKKKKKTKIYKHKKIKKKIDRENLRKKITKQTPKKGKKIMLKTL
jgi:hypothetical protein